ncbi:hypothetical protein ACFQ0O_28060 [Saccharopolyspora spinosporotrichia]
MHLRMRPPDQRSDLGLIEELSDEQTPLPERQLAEVEQDARDAARAFAGTAEAEPDGYDSDLEPLLGRDRPSDVGAATPAEDERRAGAEALVTMLADESEFAPDAGSGWEGLARSIGLDESGVLPEDFERRLLNVAELALGEWRDDAPLPDVETLRRTNSLMRQALDNGLGDPIRYEVTVDELRQARAIAEREDAGSDSMAAFDPLLGADELVRRFDPGVLGVGVQGRLSREERRRIVRLGALASVLAGVARAADLRAEDVLYAREVVEALAETVPELVGTDGVALQHLRGLIGAWLGLGDDPRSTADVQSLAARLVVLREEAGRPVTVDELGSSWVSDRVNAALAGLSSAYDVLASYLADLPEDYRPGLRAAMAEAAPYRNAPRGSWSQEDGRRVRDLEALREHLDALAAEVMSDADERPSVRRSGTVPGGSGVSELADVLPEMPRLSAARESTAGSPEGADGGAGVVESADLGELVDAFLNVVMEQPRSGQASPHPATSLDSDVLDADRAPADTRQDEMGGPAEIVESETPAFVELIPAGMLVVTDSIGEVHAAARNLPLEAGVYAVVVQGHGAGGVVVDGQPVSVQEFADLVRRGGWTPDTPIRLYACEISGEFAQGLDEELGVEVVWSPYRVWFGPGTGGYASVATGATVGADGRMLPDFPPSGTWKTTRPGGEQSVDQGPYAVRLPQGAGLHSGWVHLRMRPPDQRSDLGLFGELSDEQTPLPERQLAEVEQDARDAAVALGGRGRGVDAEALVDGLAAEFAVDGGNGWEGLARSIGLDESGVLPEDFERRLLNVAELALEEWRDGAPLPDVVTLQLTNFWRRQALDHGLGNPLLGEVTVDELRQARAIAEREAAGSDFESSGESPIADEVAEERSVFDGIDPDVARLNEEVAREWRELGLEGRRSGDEHPGAPVARSGAEPGPAGAPSSADLPPVEPSSASDSDGNSSGLSTSSPESGDAGVRAQSSSSDLGPTARRLVKALADRNGGHVELADAIGLHHQERGFRRLGARWVRDVPRRLENIVRLWLEISHNRRTVSLGDLRDVRRLADAVRRRYPDVGYDVTADHLRRMVRDFAPDDARPVTDEEVRYLAGLVGPVRDHGRPVTYEALRTAWRAGAEVLERRARSTLDELDRSLQELTGASAVAHSGLREATRSLADRARRERDMPWRPTDEGRARLLEELRTEGAWFAEEMRAVRGSSGVPAEAALLALAREHGGGRHIAREVGVDSADARDGWARLVSISQLAVFMFGERPNLEQLRRAAQDAHRFAPRLVQLRQAVGGEAGLGIGEIDEARITEHFGAAVRRWADGFEAAGQHPVTEADVHHLAELVLGLAREGDVTWDGLRRVWTAQRNEVADRAGRALAALRDSVARATEDLAESPSWYQPELRRRLDAIEAVVGESAGPWRPSYARQASSLEELRTDAEVVAAEARAARVAFEVSGLGPLLLADELVRRFGPGVFGVDGQDGLSRGDRRRIVRLGALVSVLAGVRRAADLRAEDVLYAREVGEALAETVPELSGSDGVAPEHLRGLVREWLGLGGADPVSVADVRSLAERLVVLRQESGRPVTVDELGSSWVSERVDAALAGLLSAYNVLASYLADLPESHRSGLRAAMAQAAPYRNAPRESWSREDGRHVRHLEELREELDALAAEVLLDVYDPTSVSRSATAPGGSGLSELFDVLPEVPRPSAARESSVGSPEGADGGAAVVERVDLGELVDAFLNVVAEQPGGGQDSPRATEAPDSDELDVDRAPGVVELVAAGMLVTSDSTGEVHAAARNLLVEDGVFAVVVQGDGRGGVVVDGQAVTAREFADLVRGSGWVLGTPVRLYACNISKGFAGGLDAELGVEVVWTPDMMWFGPEGLGYAPVVTGATVGADGRMVPALPATGVWYSTRPGRVRGVERAGGVSLPEGAELLPGWEHLRMPRTEPPFDSLADPGELSTEQRQLAERPLAERQLAEVEQQAREAAQTLAGQWRSVDAEALVDELAAEFALDGGNGWEGLARRIGLDESGVLPEDFERRLLNVAELALGEMRGEGPSPDVETLRRTNSLMRQALSIGLGDRQFYEVNVGEARRARELADGGTAELNWSGDADTVVGDDAGSVGDADTVVGDDVASVSDAATVVGDERRSDAEALVNEIAAEFALENGFGNRELYEVAVDELRQAPAIAERESAGADSEDSAESLIADEGVAGERSALEGFDPDVARSNEEVAQDRVEPGLEGRRSRDEHPQGDAVAESAAERGLAGVSSTSALSPVEEVAASDSGGHDPGRSAASQEPGDAGARVESESVDRERLARRLVDELAHRYGGHVRLADAIGLHHGERGFRRLGARWLRDVPQRLENLVALAHRRLGHRVGRRAGAVPLWEEINEEFDRASGVPSLVELRDVRRLVDAVRRRYPDVGYDVTADHLRRMVRDFEPGDTRPVTEDDLSYLIGLVGPVKDHGRPVTFAALRAGWRADAGTLADRGRSALVGLQLSLNVLTTAEAMAARPSVQERANQLMTLVGEERGVPWRPTDGDRARRLEELRAEGEWLAEEMRAARDSTGDPAEAALLELAREYRNGYELARSIGAYISDARDGWARLTSLSQLAVSVFGERPNRDQLAMVAEETDRLPPRLVRLRQAVDGEAGLRFGEIDEARIEEHLRAVVRRWADGFETAGQHPVTDADVRHLAELVLGQAREGEVTWDGLHRVWTAQRNEVAERTERALAALRDSSPGQRPIWRRFRAGTSPSCVCGRTASRGSSVRARVCGVRQTHARRLPLRSCARTPRWWPRRLGRRVWPSRFRVWARCCWPTSWCIDSVVMRWVWTDKTGLAAVTGSGSSVWVRWPQCWQMCGGPRIYGRMICAMPARWVRRWRRPFPS